MVRGLVSEFGVALHSELSSVIDAGRSRFGAVFGVRVIVHHSRIAEEGGHIVEIVVGHLPQAQTRSVAGRHEFRITGRAEVREAAGVFSQIGVVDGHE